MDKEFFTVLQRATISAPKAFLSPEHGLDFDRLVRSVKFKYNSYKDNPYYFKPCGTLIFSGSQGEGKTLTGVCYIKNILNRYPNCILVTNTRIKGRPINAYVFHKNYTNQELESMYSEVKENRKKAFYDEIIEELTIEFYDIKAPIHTLEDYIALNLCSYPFNQTEDFEAFRQEQCYQLRDIFTDELITPDKIQEGVYSNVTIQYSGLDCLKYVNNGKLGVLFFIDEIQLELNSLESKNIDMDVITEISQQRKQRKHIVGTSQRIMRMAKPLREQVKDIVICHCYFGVIQWNKLIDGETIVQASDGTFTYETKKRMLFYHSPDMYRAYDTYAKMQRYNNEWQVRPQILNFNLKKGDSYE